MKKVLAVDGGEAIRKKGWAPWPYFAEDEIEIVSEVLRSGKVNYWTGETKVIDHQKVRGFTGEFEFKFAKYLEAKHAIAVSNGTTALELCLYALDLSPGTEVIVPSRTFIATASACVAQGLIPVFADINPKSQCIDIESIKKACSKSTGAIICVHLAGWACEMEEIISFSQKNNIRVIEDCAQSLGAEYKNKKLGTLGDISAFSFCQDKIMTTGGEGGMVVTNQDELYLKAWTYKDHGKNYHFFNSEISSTLIEEDKKQEGMYTSIGTNFRMTEMQAAIGIKQLEKVPLWIEKRRQFAEILHSGLNDILGLTIHKEPNHIKHAYYKFHIFLNLSQLKSQWRRERIIEAIQAEGIPCQFGSTWAIGKESGWSNVKIIGLKNINIQKDSHFPNDSDIGPRSIILYTHPTLDTEAIEDTVKAVKKVMSAAVKY